MNSRIALIGAGVALLVSSAGGIGAASRHTESADTRAAVVAARFFRSLNERRYGETCRLLSARFYRENHVPNRTRCVLGLRVGFAWAPEIRFRIVDVHIDGHRAVVSAVANGAPGRIALVEEGGLFKILSVRGA